MPRQYEILAAFVESVTLNPKGYRYVRTRDFVSNLQRRGWHFTEREANDWIERNQIDFADKTPDESENRLWMLRNMGIVRRV